MDTYRVKPIKEKKNIEVSVPGSKSITNRALMLAAMADGVCTLNGVLFSADSRAFLDCLIQLGFAVDIDETACRVVIKGEQGNVPNKKATIHVQSAGTAARFMTVFLAVAGGDYVLNSSEQMKKRPMKELLDSLIEKGVEIRYLEQEGHFPFEMHSKGIGNTDMVIDTTTSSQYASALLMAAVRRGMKVTLTGTRVQGAYIQITLRMMEQFGIGFDVKDNTYTVQPQNYSCAVYDIEPDMSAACYFYAMSLILRTKSLVRGIHFDSMQGDIQFLRVLENLGCRVYERKKSEIASDEKIVINKNTHKIANVDESEKVGKETGDGIVVDATDISDYDGIAVDMSNFSDQALTMAVVAAFAKSPSRIQNIGHIRGQESDRVQVIADELAKLGCETKIIEENGQTDVEIIPGKLHGAEIETYDDHRVAMSFAMAGLVVDGVVIQEPMCCRKTFENYFDLLDKITD